MRQSNKDQDRDSSRVGGPGEGWQGHVRRGGTKFSRNYTNLKWNLIIIKIIYKNLLIN